MRPNRPYVIVTVGLPDVRLSLLAGGVGDARRVGPHVRDETHGAFGAEVDALIQRLCELHDTPDSNAQAPRCFLLQGRGRKWRCRIAALLALLDARSAPGSRPHVAGNLVGRGAVADLELLAVARVELGRKGGFGTVRR